jgi:hypothetical protein
MTEILHLRDGSVAIVPRPADGALRDRVERAARDKTTAVHLSGMPALRFVAADGSGLTEVSTDQGFAVSAFDRRVRSAP